MSHQPIKQLGWCAVLAAAFLALPAAALGQIVSTIAFDSTSDGTDGAYTQNCTSPQTVTFDNTADFNGDSVFEFTSVTIDALCTIDFTPSSSSPLMRRSVSVARVNTGETSLALNGATETSPTM